MTKLKVSSKFKLFLIISIAIMVIGMAIGTVGHFFMNGFFSYGDEYSSYKSVVVRYIITEENVKVEEEMKSVKAICEEVLSSSKGGYSTSYSKTNNGGEIVYKFSANADDEALAAIARKMNSELNKIDGEGIADLNVASGRTGTIKATAPKALTFAAIAVASAAAFQFLYYILRYKLRAACTALLACIHNLGLFVALVALTRIPVGAELIALAALVVFLTMLGCGVFFDKTRRNFKNEKYADADRAEVVDMSAAESHKINIVTVIAVMAVAVVFGVFAAIASMGLAAFLITPVVILGALACCYGTVYFAPSVYTKIDALCEKIKTAEKKKKTDGKSKPAVSDKAQA